MVEVSPIDPWILPMKAVVQLTSAVSAPIPSAATKPSGVAPVKPSTAVQIASPLICAG